ncbi:hypothetical protein CY652_10645 [Burkholderia sp. WAC0059]|uniref:hypothetical protein n=1 Tax=Burkholderia sp. WAC0059 TaxID=2066022 RepID=UPI000CB53F1F|nr:hypothetical protein [Burkholderia sp. WAC0059]PLZ02561.1 hypothetical protein CY652_10645 [Burkholderia sp. WAC0059]
MNDSIRAAIARERERIAQILACGIRVGHIVQAASLACDTDLDVVAARRVLIKSGEYGSTESDAAENDERNADKFDGENRKTVDWIDKTDEERKSLADKIIEIGEATFGARAGTFQPGASTQQSSSGRVIRFDGTRARGRS